MAPGRALATLGLMAALLLAESASAPQPVSAPRSVTYASRTMGTYAHVTLVTADSAEAWPEARAAQGAFHRVDSLMSNWTTTSEVARLNREAWPGPTPVEAEVARVLARALDVFHLSDGAQDITVEPLVRLWGFLGGKPHVPAESDVRAAFRHVGSDKLRFDASASTLQFAERGVQIDLGGIAKGYAVDQAAEQLLGSGVRDALVDVSGNMRALGLPPGGTAWRIGIRDPRDRMPYFARLRITQQGVSTSGKYEQFVAADGRTYGHILDPRTGRPAEGLLSVTVVSANALTSDAWDTGLFVLGLDAARRKALERDDIDVVLVAPGQDGIDTVWVERSLKDRFELLDSARSTFRLEYF
jgi:thiamine biosynthesis lipoprotein